MRYRNGRQIIRYRRLATSKLDLHLGRVPSIESAGREFPWRKVIGGCPRSRDTRFPRTCVTRGAGDSRLRVRRSTLVESRVCAPPKNRRFPDPTKSIIRLWRSRAPGSIRPRFGEFRDVSHLALLPSTITTLRNKDIGHAQIIDIILARQRTRSDRRPRVRRNFADCFWSRVTRIRRYKISQSSPYCCNKLRKNSSECADKRWLAGLRHKGK